MNAKRAWIKENECGGFCLCSDIAPALFKSQEKGPTGIVMAQDVAYSNEETKLLIEGAYACPLGAIYIELENGETLNEVTKEQYEKYISAS